MVLIVYKGSSARKRERNAKDSAGLYSGTVCPEPL